MRVPLFLTVATMVTMAFTACNNQSATNNADSTAVDTSATSTIKLKEETVTYKDDTATLIGYVVYNENSAEKRPAVLVVPEWWGLTDYARNRARQLAELGYIAIAVDMYGNGAQAANPEEAGKLAGAFYKSPALMKSRVEAAMAQLKTYSQTDTARMAGVGYCFGGAVLLNAAKLGTPLKALVSFHGSLAGVPANKDLLKSKILICHGEADSFVPEAEVAAFRKSMDSIKVDYTFKSYPMATHAFTNPDATATGKKFNMPIEYNAAADTASWNDMKAFFGRVF